MYSIKFYGEMLNEAPRMDPYVEALRRAVKPDSVVMDLGCGPGVFALLACQLGARRVYAVEPDSVINLARELASANGVADRIEFFEAFSTEISLPEPATIIISDLRGVLPLFERHIPSIIDARERLLAPGGVLIPQRDILWAAPIDSHEIYENLVGPWLTTKFGLDLSAGLRLITNRWIRRYVRPEELLADPLCWGAIDYHVVDSPNLCAELSWRVPKNGTAHAFAVWFDTDLVDCIGFSNHPKEEDLVYGNGFFPFSQPVKVTEGDRIKVQLTARMVNDDYVWRWDTDFFAADGETQPKASFKQSTFFGVPLSPAKLRELKQYEA